MYNHKTNVKRNRRDNDRRKRVRQLENAVLGSTNVTEVRITTANGVVTFTASYSKGIS